MYNWKHGRERREWAHKIARSGETYRKATRTFRRRLARLGILTAVLTVAPVAAWSETILSAAGGVFVPYDGSAGVSGLVQLLGSGSEKFRFGGEIEYRRYDSSIFGVDDVGFDSGSIRAIAQYHLWPDSSIDPYVGAGFGADFNVIDADKVERELEARGNAFASVQEFGVGLGLLGLVGVEVPLTPAVALFAEGRAGLAFQLTEQSDLLEDEDDIGIENLGGFNGLGGVRIRF